MSPSDTESKWNLPDHLQNYKAAYIVLACSLLLTWAGYIAAKNSIERKVHERFSLETEKIHRAIARRLDNYRVALFAASDLVSRKEWKRYHTVLELDRMLPGIQGFGFSKVIPPQMLESHISQIRAEGFPEYTVKPAGNRDLFTSIIFLEPFAGRNLRAFGYDMFSEPVRRAAMERARDTGDTSISGKVTLIQETNQDVQSGFLIYLPVYEKGADISSLEERRNRIFGFVYAPFRMNDFMQGFLGSENFKVDIEIHQNDASGQDNAMFQSNPKVEDNLLELSTEIDFYGVSWLLKTKANSSFLTWDERTLPLTLL
jgi:CHASE1-domain containing sensor protein